MLHLLLVRALRPICRKRWKPEVLVTRIWGVTRYYVFFPAAGGTDSPQTFTSTEEESDANCRFAPAEKFILQIDGGPSVAADELLVLEYRPMRFDVVIVQDDASIAAVAAIEGGSASFSGGLIWKFPDPEIRRPLRV